MTNAKLPKKTAECPGCGRTVRVVFWLNNPDFPQYARHYVNAGVRFGKPIRAACLYSRAPVPASVRLSNP